MTGRLQSTRLSIGVAADYQKWRNADLQIVKD